MNPLVLQILQTIVAVGPGVGQAIIALVQAIGGQHPTQTRETHDEIVRLVAEHSNTPIPENSARAPAAAGAKPQDDKAKPDREQPKTR